ncbi:hypothetical protein [Hydrogenimonas sp.]
MKKFTLFVALFVAGSVAMAEDTVSYDFSSAVGSSDTVHYDTASGQKSTDVVHYDIRENDKTLQNTSKTENK